jgi:hypothetical protein
MLFDVPLQNKIYIGKPKPPKTLNPFPFFVLVHHFPTFPIPSCNKWFLFFRMSSSPSKKNKGTSA